MKYALVDEWIVGFCHENNYKEKDIVVEIFPQAVTLDGKMKVTQVTIIREKNFETDE